MSRLFKIAAVLIICFGIFNLAVTIRNLNEKIILDRIADNGSVTLGIIENVDQDNRDKVQIRINQESYSKETNTSENYYQIGDTVKLYHYSAYPSRYIFTYEYIEPLAIFIGVAVSLVCFLPILILFRKKR